MPDLVGDHVRPGKLPGGAELFLQHPEERHVDVHAGVARTVERADAGVRRPTPGIRLASEQHQGRVLVRLPELLELVLPNDLGVVEDDLAELGHLLFGRVRGPGRLAGPLAEELLNVDPEDHSENDQDDPSDPAADHQAGLPHAPTILDVFALFAPFPLHGPPPLTGDASRPCAQYSPTRSGNVRLRAAQTGRILNRYIFRRTSCPVPRSSPGSSWPHRSSPPSSRPAPTGLASSFSSPNPPGRAGRSKPTGRSSRPARCGPSSTSS